LKEARTVKKEEILAKLQSGELSVEEASKLLSDAAAKHGNLSCKVSEKGAVSVYGLQARFPVTLYAEQWARLLEFGDTLKEFIKDNEGRLKKKDAAAPPKA
jgi:hypothetical protein